MNSGGPLSAIVWFSLRFRGVVIALAFALVGYGVYALSGAKYDVFPEFAPPRVTIQCEAPGLSPEQVESLVTRPIENEVNGVPDIESLRSSSIQGLSLVSVTFRSNSDIYRARQTVAERLATLNGQLPQGVRAPNMTPLNLLHKRRSEYWTDIGRALADGSTHACGLDDETPSACGSRCGESQRFRR